MRTYKLNLKTIDLAINALEERRDQMGKTFRHSEYALFLMNEDFGAIEDLKRYRVKLIKESLEK